MNHINFGPDVRRQGSILILVVGVASLLAVTATAILLRVQADGRANRVVVQDAQCRLALTSALHFLLETSRIGWGENGEEAYGWVDIRDGEPGPRIAGEGPVGAGNTWPQLGSVFRGDMFALRRPPYAMDINPAPAPVPWEVGDSIVRSNFQLVNLDDNRHRRGSKDSDADIQTAEMKVTEVRHEPNRDDYTGLALVEIYSDAAYTNLVYSNQFVYADGFVDQTEWEFNGETNRMYVRYGKANADGSWRHDDNTDCGHKIDVILQVDEEIPFDDAYSLFDPNSGPEEWLAGRERILNQDVMRDFLERPTNSSSNANYDGNWSDDSRALMSTLWNAHLSLAWEEVALTPKPHPDASTWDSFESGDTSPRGESLGRGWFRVYRELAAESLADDFLPGSTFVITVGAGGTRGFKDWAEAAGSGLFPSESVFNSLRRSERLQWWRVRWVPQVGGSLDAAWQHWLRRVQAPKGTHGHQRASGWNNDKPADHLLTHGTHLTLLATNLDATKNTSQPFPVVQQGGSIDWMYRLTEEPEEW